MAGSQGALRRAGRLTAAEQRLVEAARGARQRAHAPYSRFSVGAALLCAEGRIYTGCNVENSSFGLTVCAERNAVASAIVAGERQFEAMVIASDCDPPATPCGACRQVISEFAPDLQLLLSGSGEAVQRVRLSRLLPHRFVELEDRRRR